MYKLSFHRENWPRGLSHLQKIQWQISGSTEIAFTETKINFCFAVCELEFFEEIGTHFSMLLTHSPWPRPGEPAGGLWLCHWVFQGEHHLGASWSCSLINSFANNKSSHSIQQVNLSLCACYMLCSFYTLCMHILAPSYPVLSIYLFNKIKKSTLKSTLTQSHWLYQCIPQNCISIPAQATKLIHKLDT